MEGIVLFFARQDNTHQCRNDEHACLLYFDIQGSDIVAKMIKQLRGTSYLGASWKAHLVRWSRDCKRPERGLSTGRVVERSIATLAKLPGISKRMGYTIGKGGAT